MSGQELTQHQVLQARQRLMRRALMKRLTTIDQLPDGDADPAVQERALKDWGPTFVTHAAQIVSDVLAMDAEQIMRLDAYEVIPWYLEWKDWR